MFFLKYFFLKKGGGDEIFLISKKILRIIKFFIFPEFFLKIKILRISGKVLKSQKFKKYFIHTHKKCVDRFFFEKKINFFLLFLQFNFKVKKNLFYFFNIFLLNLIKFNEKILKF